MGAETYKIIDDIKLRRKIREEKISTELLENTKSILDANVKYSFSNINNLSNKDAEIAKKYVGCLPLYVINLPERKIRDALNFLILIPYKKTFVEERTKRDPNFTYCSATYSPIRIDFYDSSEHKSEKVIVGLFGLYPYDYIQKSLPEVQLFLTEYLTTRKNNKLPRSPSGKTIIYIENNDHIYRKINNNSKELFFNIKGKRSVYISFIKKRVFAFSKEIAKETDQTTSVVDDAIKDINERAIKYLGVSYDMIINHPNRGYYFNRSKFTFRFKSSM